MLRNWINGERLSHRQFPDSTGRLGVRLLTPAVRFASRTLSGCLLLVCVVISPVADGRAEPGEFRYLDVRLMRGPCCSDMGSDLVVDSDGNVLIAGRRGSLDLDYDGTIDIKTFGQPDPLISKLLQADRMDSGWTKEVGGSGDDGARGIATDHDGGLYAVGHFSQQMQYGNGFLKSEGGKDGFIARYDRDGRPLWARAIGGTGLDEMYRVASDTKGNAYVIGTATGNVDIDRDGNVDIIGTAKGSALVTAWDSDGDFLWARVSGGDARVLGLGIATGPGDNVYIAGAYQDGAPDFDGNGEADGPIAKTIPPTGPDDQPDYDLNAYYASLDNAGRVNWINTVSGPSIQSAGGLAVSDNGDLFVLGGHTAPSDSDGDGVADIDFVALGDRKNQYQLDGNLFLLRVTPGGDALWNRIYTAMGTHLSLRGGRLLISGTYANDLDFDNDGVLERESDGDDRPEGFVAVLNETGDLQQLLTIVGEAADVVNAAALSPDGRTLYMTGYTQLGADFNGDGVVEASSVCHLAGEVYVAMYEFVEDE